MNKEQCLGANKCWWLTIRANVQIWPSGDIINVKLITVFSHSDVVTQKISIMPHWLCWCWLSRQTLKEKLVASWVDIKQQGINLARGRGWYTEQNTVRNSQCWKFSDTWPQSCKTDHEYISMYSVVYFIVYCYLCFNIYRAYSIHKGFIIYVNFWLQIIYWDVECHLSTCQLR